MSSWFGTKAEQGVIFTSPRSSLDKPSKRVIHYSTPHDTILAELHSSPDRVASPEPADLTHGTPSLHPYQPSSPEFLLDPFDGTSLGTLVPHSQDSEVHSPPAHTNLSSPEVGTSQSANANATAPSELVWSHLTNILDLQSQISKMHLEMENIGSVDVKSKKHGFSHKSTLSNASTAGVSSGAKRAAPEDPSTPPGSNTRERGLSTGSSSDEPEGDEENVPSEEAEKNKAREEEFASLAHQFEGRKQAINDIMDKVFTPYCFPLFTLELISIQCDDLQLGDLFNELSEFHTLQAPNLDFPASRQNSSTVTSPLSPPVVAETDVRVRIPSQASTSRTVANNNALLEPAPRKMAALKKPFPPTLLVNSMDLASEGNIHYSPVSTLGSKPED